MSESLPWIAAGCALAGFLALVSSVCTAKMDADAMLDKYDQVLRNVRDERSVPRRSNQDE